MIFKTVEIAEVKVDGTKYARIRFPDQHGDSIELTLPAILFMSDPMVRRFKEDFGNLVDLVETVIFL